MMQCYRLKYPMVYKVCKISPRKTLTLHCCNSTFTYIKNPDTSSTAEPLHSNM